MRVVSTSDAEYGEMLRDYVAGATFAPGRVGNRSVRQRTRASFTAGVRVEVRRGP